ncbi:DUF378 domain-containing protein [Candidatus Azambacteria bacterium]|nr:DUF378 domain-containing protein [Candidatus Azambacteria bacterium]
MNKLNALDWLSFILVIIGGLNWLLVGLFNWNLVSAIFGDMSALSRLIYDLVGLAALYLLAMMSKYCRK